MLGGYADRVGGASGTHDDLEIGVLALRSGDGELVIVTVDAIAVDGRLASEVATAAGVDRDGLLIAASHTHSGPLGVVRRLHPAGPETTDAELRQRFVTSLARTIRDARQRLEEVTLAHAEAVVAGVWGNRNDPGQITDQRVRTLQVRASDGALRCLLLLVPCHPTVLGATSRHVSADLHGGVRQAVRAALPTADGPLHLLTATGAAGDISTRFTRQESSFAEVERIGQRVAMSVVPSLDEARPVSSGLRTAARSTWLPMRQVDAAAAARALDASERALREGLADPAVSVPERRRRYTRVQGARLSREMGELPPVDLAIKGWRLGADFAMLALPGELFSSLGSAIEARASGSTWPVGYANGYLGYLPDDAAHADSTYEALASPYAPSVGATVVELAGAVLDALET